MFEKNVDVYILTNNDRNIADRSCQIVNDFLTISHQHIEKIKNFYGKIASLIVKPLVTALMCLMVKMKLKSIMKNSVYLMVRML
jgi:hypothetical protein